MLTISYENLGVVIAGLYRNHPTGIFYFDFDNVLYNRNISYAQNAQICMAVCTIPLDQRKILTARSSTASLKECYEIVQGIGYDFKPDQIVSGGYDKDQVLEDEAKRVSTCENCNSRMMFFFDDNVYHIAAARERNIENLSVYWVDHYPSHHRLKITGESDVTQHSDFPFLSVDGGKTLVYQAELDKLSLDDLHTRRDFYHRVDRPTNVGSTL
jgi:hypothetical protein